MFEKIVVTGAAAGIARYVIHDLKDSCDLTLVDVEPGESSAAIRQVDILDSDALRSIFQNQDAVVHLAAIDSGSFKQMPATDATLSVNVRGTWNVLEIARECGLRKAIIMSSEAGLGMEYLDVDPPPHYLPIDEQHPFRPSDVYGLSKQLCESIGQNFARRGDLSIVCLRPTEVTFPEMIADMTSRLNSEISLGARTVTRTWEDRFALAISRAYVRPDDMARMVRLALEVETKRYEVFWASAAGTYAPQPTLELLRDLHGSLPEVRRPRLYEDIPNAAVFDISAARERLGWEPTGSWKQSLDEITNVEI